MTLIAAFRCYEGVVLCADSQETVDIPERGSYRVNVTKIEPRDAGNYEVVIGGGGDGDLVDDFGDRLTDYIAGWPDRSEREMRDEIRAFVQHFYEVDVPLSPAPEDDKNLGFIVCLRSKAKPGIFLWRISGLRVFTVTEKTLLGWEEKIYWHEVDRLYQPNWVSNHAMLLGLHLLTIAKQTSNVVGGESRVILVRDHAMNVVPSEDVNELEQMLATFNKMVDDLRLILPNMSLPLDEFRTYVTDFKDRVIELHERLLGRIAQESLARALSDSSWTGHPFPKLPPGLEVFSLMSKDQTDAFINDLEAKGVVKRLEKSEAGVEPKIEIYGVDTETGKALARIRRPSSDEKDSEPTQT